MPIHRLARLVLVVLIIGLSSPARSNPVTLSLTETDSYGQTGTIDAWTVDAGQGITNEQRVLIGQSGSAVFFPPPGEQAPFGASFLVQFNLSGLNGDPSIEASETLSVKIEGYAFQPEWGLQESTVSGSVSVSNLVLAPGIALAELPGWFTELNLQADGNLQLANSGLYDVTGYLELSPGSAQEVPEPKPVFAFAGALLILGLRRRRSRNDWG